MRSSALVHLLMDQFSKVRLRVEYVLRIREAIGSWSGASKTRFGGWHGVGQKPSEIFIWNPPSINGILNMFEDIEDNL